VEQVKEYKAANLGSGSYKTARERESLAFYVGEI